MSARRLAACLTLIGVCIVPAACATGPGSGEMNLEPEVAASPLDADRPPTPQTLFRLARMFSGAGRDADAAAVLTTCIQRHPRFTPAYVELAGIYVRADEVDEAVTILNRGLDAGLPDATLLNDLGMCYMLRGDYERAAREFDRAAAIAPRDRRVVANRALAAGMLGDYDRALSLYKTVLPAHDAHYNLAIVCEARDDHERAAREHELAQLPPGDGARQQVP